MSAIRDLFADFDADASAPTPTRQPIAQPDPPICQPPPAVAPATSMLRGTPRGMIAEACLCGAQGDRAADDAANRRCWKCGEADGLRPLPWRPTPAEAARA